MLSLVALILRRLIEADCNGYGDLTCADFPI